MSFIFRAYHAMARQRPMSTKTGVPTSATYVFVNMLNKLRKDFAPEHIAAVFDVAAPTFRDGQAAAMPSLRKYDRESGEYKQVAYDGYKAQRVAMPEDLAQQIPYIRRALEIYRIPILEAAGFEADDVLGTLARLAAAESYAVYVVSSDKDMLQLVNERVCVLNPPKDNLICDRAKVEEILGVPPERVIDVMALRGDSIDNVPGAPGIGDKGSVELIQRFGSLDNLLEHVGEVERKTYRESLLHNREAVLLSRELVTINRDVAVEFNPESMKAQSPDVPAARQLFTELEFTSLLKEFLEEGTEIGETEYREAQSASDVESVLAAVPKGGALALAIESAASAAAVLAGEPGLTNGAEAEEAEDAEDKEDKEEPPPLFAAAEAIAAVQRASEAAAQRPQRIAISARAGTAMVVQLGDEKLRSALAKSTEVPLAVHDYKSAIPTLCRNLGLELGPENVRHDLMLYAYLLDPTYSTYTLQDLALRKLSLRLAGEVAEAADVTGRLLSLRQEVEDAGLLEVYERIDLPLVPVLWRMEEAGVKLDCGLLAGLSVAAGARLPRQGARNPREGRRRVQHQLAQAAWRCVVQPAQSSQAAEVRQRTDNLDRAGCAGNTGLRARSSPPRARLPPALEVEVDLCRCAAGFVPRRNQPPAHQLQSGWDGDRPAVFQQSEPAEHSHSHRAGPRDSRGLHRRARQRAAQGRLFADRAAADGALLGRRFAHEGLSQRRRRAQGDGERTVRRSRR